MRVSLRSHPRQTKRSVDQEDTEILMKDIDAGAYLTERLRSNQPEPFAQEIARTTRRAVRRGFLLGVFSSFIVVMAWSASSWLTTQVWSKLCLGSSNVQNGFDFSQEVSQECGAEAHGCHDEQPPRDRKLGVIASTRPR